MTAAPFSISLELVFGQKGQVHKDLYNAGLGKAAEALDWLREQQRENSLELLGIPSRTDDLKAAARRAGELKGSVAQAWAARH